MGAIVDQWYDDNGVNRVQLLSNHQTLIFCY